MGAAPPARPRVNGLTSAEAAARLERVGPNALPETPADALWRRLVRQFASPLIAILLFALAFDLGLWGYEGFDGWPLESIAIGLILMLNAALGVAQEYRSEAALARLEALAGAEAWVLRDGQLTRVPVQALVPDDRVRLEAGDRVPADGRLVEARGALLDESVLTGESVPVDRIGGDEVFSGTLLVRGTAWIDVTRTGQASAMGRLATMLGGIEAGVTPLERRVDRLGRRIARWVLALAGGMALLGVGAEGLARAPEMIIFAVALAVAAVPEGLPAVLTVALALGVERMAARKAVVRRLAAVEALGSVSVIATDKTGTLTESRMDVRAIETLDADRALQAIALANDADPANGAGDPLDQGLLRHAEAQGIDVAALRAAHPVASTRPFDSEWKFTRATVREDAGTISYLKGAPEVLLPRCTLSPQDRDSWTEKAGVHAAQGFRVLAIAWGQGDTEDTLEFLGLVLFWDPPRAEVADAVRRAQAAGVRVVMITGDHPATALAIARQVGIESARVLTGEDLDGHDPEALAAAFREVNVFARVRPEQKLQLVEGLQAQGETVAMTGDGVNDAPALKRADVGVAMGIRGSDVSREVADLVLLDDNFSTIVAAIEEGRIIYGNIQKFLRFLFSTNLSEVLVVAVGAALAFALDLRTVEGALLLPLTAAQILWINLVTDGLPALALALDRTPGVMDETPRPPDAPLLARPSLRFIVATGSITAAMALALLWLVPRLGYDVDLARGVVFHFLATAQLLITYQARRARVHPLPNRALHLAVAGGLVLQTAAVTLPWSAGLLGTTAMPAALWALAAACAVAAWGLAGVAARAAWRRA